MRIAVFAKGTTFHAGSGGLESQNRILCEGMAKRGHNIVIFTPRKELSEAEKVLNGVRYVFIPCVFRSLFSSFLASHWYNRSYAVFAKENAVAKFDLVISQSSAGIGVIKRKASLGIKVVSIVHGSMISEIKTRLANISSVRALIMLVPDIPYVLYAFFGKQREFILASDRVVAVSNYVKQAVVEETFALAERFVVIHNGVDPSRYLGRETAGVSSALDSPVHILFVGRLEKEKGIDTLASMAKDPAFKNVVFDVVGSGSYVSCLKDPKGKLPFTNLELHGKLPFEQTVDIYNDPRMRVFVFPTRRYEGFPMVLVEAMFAKLPVVAFDIGGVSDAVVNGVTGFLVKPGDSKAFQEMTLKLVQEAETARQMGEAGRNKALSEFTLETMLDAYEKVFAEVLQ